jgi:diguanylate cyclase (GGDEF)-like protein
MHKGIRGIHWFSFYNAFLFVGAVLVAFRGHVPNFLSIVVGNMFVVSGYVVLFVSLAKFFGTRLSQISIQLALTAVAVVTMLQYGWLHPDTNKRLLAYSVVLCAQQIHIALFTARKERRHTHAAVSMAFIFAMLALMNLLRIVTIFVNGVPQDYLASRGGLVLMVLCNTALQCGAIVSYVWMTASILRSDLARQASTDPLTGLLNRRAMDGAAQQVLSSSSPGQPASAIAIDLNDFKSINDSFGHSCGDATLTAVARCLQLGLRQSDFVGRMGGDEFIALLPQTSFETATEIAEKLDDAIRSMKVTHGQAQITVSASFGCAQADNAGCDWDHLLLQCDKQLYESKKKREAKKSQIRKAIDSSDAMDTAVIPVFFDTPASGAKSPSKPLTPSR